MTTYSDVFGGANIYPADVSYSLLALTADVQLAWPEETSTSLTLVTRIMNVTASGDGLSATMPDAREASNGETVLFNNIGSFNVTIRKADGVQLVVLTPGTVWQVYLNDNTTLAGLWNVFQYGASTSQADASALAGTGIIAVGTLLSQSVPVTNVSGAAYIAGPVDRATMFLWTTSGGSFILPSAVSLGNNWFVYIRNNSPGTVSIEPASPGLAEIDGLASLLLQPGESAIVVSDGLDFYTIGLGQSATFAFDYTSIDISGTGDYTLSSSQLNRIAYDFTGLLTGNRNVIIPATVQQYWLSNSTTGAFDVTFKTSGGTGIILGQGERGIFYCNGIDLVDADTSTVSLPVQVSQGGTGATTESNARINLGGTGLGIGVFTAPDYTTLWNVLGAVPKIWLTNVDGGTF